MFGLEPVTIGGIMILAAANPAAVCQMPKPTDISVTPSSAPLEYDHSGNLNAIQSQNIDTINPFGFDANSHTQGFASNLIKPTWNIRLGRKYLPNYNAYCVWYDAIELNIAITPKITIAKEIYENKCKYQHVNEHELKHIKAARMIANKYSKTMGRKIYNGLSERGFMAGPIPAASAEQAMQRMEQTVGQLLELEIHKMDIEHRELQQSVDSRQEYERVNALTSRCPKGNASAYRRHAH